MVLTCKQDYQIAEQRPGIYLLFDLIEYNMLVDENTFQIPIDPLMEVRYNTSLEQILEQGGRINIGYNDGSFEIPFILFGGEVKGTYSIDDGILHIKIDEFPEGLTVEDIRTLCIKTLGLTEKDLDLYDSIL